MKKPIVIAVLAAILLAFALPSPQAQAAETIQNSMFGDTQPKMSDGKKAYYQLDVTTVPEEDDDKNAAEEAIQNAKDFITGKPLKEGFKEQFFELENSIADLIFQLNIFLTSATIKVLDLAFNYTIINKIIDKIDTAMIALTGIKGGVFTNSGLIGSFVGIAAALTAIVALYLFAWKRAPLGAFKSIGSTILVLALALVFFSQYATFLKGANQISTEASQIVLTTPSSVLSKTARTPEEIRKDMFKNLQDQFIHRPYLYMMYGTDETKKIGEKRINELLKKKPGEDRQKYVEEQEVTKKKNMNMTYANVQSRLIFTAYYMFINTINGSVLIILALALVVIQFWFITMACVAPFAFAWAMFPQQGGVLKNYSFRLSEPLLIKVMLSLITFVFFTISTLSYQLDLQDAASYFDTSIAQLAIYILMLVLGNKIKKIFKTSKQFRYIMSEVKEFRKSMLHSATQITQVAATAAGAIYGGPQGAAAGYQAGEAIKGAVNQASSNSDDETEYKDSDRSAPLTSISEGVKNNNWTAPEIVDWREKDKTPQLAKTGEKSAPKPQNEKPKAEPQKEKENSKDNSYVELVPLSSYYDDPEELAEKMKKGAKENE